jgi:hypothetical protein
MGANKTTKEEQHCCELTSEEMKSLQFIFETILKTQKTPSVKEMQTALKKPHNEIVRILGELEKKDVLLRKRGTQKIVSIYPLSLTPTEHQIILKDGKKLFAMCAVDALGMPIMLDKEATIVSQCKKCKQDIKIEIKNEEIARTSHPGIMIWSPRQQMAPAAKTCCPSVNFFCCKEHLDEWTKENPSLVGRIGKINRVFTRIKNCWRLYGETLGLRS